MEREEYEEVEDGQVNHGGFGTVRPFKRKSDGKWPVNSYPSTRLNHPNVVQFYGTEWTSKDDGVKIYTEFMPNQNLQSYIKTNLQDTNRRPSDREAWSLICQLSAALAYCHHGLIRRQETQDGRMLRAEDWTPILHRDIKPDNVLVDCKSHGQPVFKLCDFGLSVFQSPNETKKHSFGGTRPYIAPEVTEDNPNWSNKADIFAVGCTFYSFYNKGAPPWLYHLTNESSAKVPSLPEDAPKDIKDLIYSCVSFNEEDRLGADNLFKDALKHVDKGDRALASLPLNHTTLDTVSKSLAVNSQDKAGFQSMQSIVSSGDDKLVASASNDNMVMLWNSGLQNIIRWFKGDSFGITAVAFSPDSIQVALASSNGKVTLWNSKTGEIGHILGYDGQPGDTGATFSPDGKLVAVISRGKVTLWDSNKGELCWSLRGRYLRDETKVAFSPDGTLVACASTYDIISICNSATGAEHARLYHPSDRVKIPGVITLDYVTAVAFSPNGKLIATASSSGTVRLWNSGTGMPGTLYERHILMGHSSRTTAVAFSPNSELLASASCDSTVRLWNSETGKPSHILRGHFPHRVTGVTFSPNGQLVASVSGDETIGSIDSAATVVFSPDSRYVASTSRHIVIIWDSDTGRPLQKRWTCSYGETAVAFSPDGELVVIASDNEVRLCDSTLLSFSDPNCFA
ncbi:hypothetical protein V499_03317 [Pseudogymnoascus sp. VKM F-103]|nr:hypothetical protein V499_03317 [Pseudogymnoascus sp. VKM F-103]